MSEDDPDTLANQIADLNAHWLAENTWLATEYEKAKAQLQAENERLAGELTAAKEAHDALHDEYADLAQACAEQSAELAIANSTCEHLTSTCQELENELARVTAAARAFLAMSTNVTLATLAEAVRET